MYIADFLSRSPLTEKREHHEQVSVFYQKLEELQLEDNVNIMMDSLEEVRTHMKAAEVLQKLTKIVAQGWPNERSAVPEELR